MDCDQDPQDVSPDQGPKRLLLYLGPNRLLFYLVGYRLTGNVMTSIITLRQDGNILTIHAKNVIFNYVM